MLRRGIITRSFHPQPSCIISPATMLILPGSNALSAFRTRSLLSQLQTVAPAIVGVSGRFHHFIDSSAALADDDVARLRALLTYGEPFAASEEGEQLVVIPRFGTISPWASKATDIAHNCGMPHIHRIERGVVYHLQLKTGLLGGTKKLAEADLPALAALLHDRMTETVLREPQRSGRPVPGTGGEAAGFRRRPAARQGGAGTGQWRTWPGALGR